MQIAIAEHGGRLLAKSQSERTKHICVRGQALGARWTGVDNITYLVMI